MANITKTLPADYVAVVKGVQVLGSLGRPEDCLFEDRIDLLGLPDTQLLVARRPRSDALTGLADRETMLEALADALAQAPSGIAVIDLDRFKRINNSFGHKVGDEVLVRIAQRLVSAAGRGHVVGRLGGDGFGVVCTAVEASALATRLAVAVARPLAMYGRDAVVTASIGVACGGRRDPAADLLRNAEIALELAKEQGRSRIEYFDDSLHKTMLEKVRLEQMLRTAMRDGDLELHYQPVRNLDTNDIVAVEALVRWDHPTMGLVPPSRFVPLAEDTGLVYQLGRWVLESGCRQAAAWQWRHPGLRVNINLSGNEFSDPLLIDEVLRMLDACSLPAAALGLEVTEGVLMADMTGTIATLERLREIGVYVAVDDFGTGYSSLAYLKELPVDALKIDKAFIDGVGTKPQADAIVAAILAMAAALELSVVAEGVETDVQMRALRKMGCEYVQGYYTGMPAPSSALLTN